MKLSKAQMQYLENYKFSFEPPSDLASLYKAQLLELLVRVDGDIGENDGYEPTEKSNIAESIYEIVQDEMPDMIKALDSYIDTNNVYPIIYRRTIPKP